MRRPNVMVVIVMGLVSVLCFAMAVHIREQQEWRSSPYRSLELVGSEGERFVGRENPAFPALMRRVCELRPDMSDAAVSIVRGVTQTKGIVFVAFDNGDYSLISAFHDFSAGK